MLWFVKSYKSFRRKRIKQHACLYCMCNQRKHKQPIINYWSEKLREKEVSLELRKFSS